MKVQEAMATATPVVATSTANRGVGAAPGDDLLVADNSEDFASEVIKLLHDGQLRDKLGRAGRAYVERNFSWDSHARQVSEIYGAVRAAA
jgi:glycosyltransferase involved in cell wall biosynthesis